MQGQELITLKETFPVTTAPNNNGVLKLKIKL